MSGRVIVAELDGRQRDVVATAAGNVQRIEKEVNRLLAQGEAAMGHYRDVLAAATGEEPEGLAFDADTGVVFRPAEVDNG